MSFENIKRNFDRGLWNAQMVAMAVVKNVITAEQYKEITGDDYSAWLKLHNKMGRKEELWIL